MIPPVTLSCSHVRETLHLLTQTNGEDAFSYKRELL